MPIVHRTPGLIDPRAFTLMGVSAKPGTTAPIGMFGTGLKYAISTLVRLGAGVSIWIGRDRYTFECRPGEFRGQQIEHIVFRRHRWSLTRATTHELPYTTSYGRFWRPWMALRELHSNTLDEGGETYQTDQETLGQDGQTLIVVSHPEYDHAWSHIDEVFLPGATRHYDSIVDAEALPAQSPSMIYYRGLRVMDLSKPSVRTWNILRPIELTEDRTLKYEHAARSIVASWIALRCEDEEILHDVLSADDDHWESTLEWPTWTQPSQQFRSAMARWGRRHSSAYGYYTSYIPREPRPEYGVRQFWLDYPGPWTVDDDQIVGSNGTPVLARPADMDPDVWTACAEAVIHRCGRQEEEIET